MSTKTLKTTLSYFIFAIVNCLFTTSILSAQEISRPLNFYFKDTTPNKHYRAILQPLLGLLRPPALHANLPHQRIYGAAAATSGAILLRPDQRTVASQYLLYGDDLPAAIEIQRLQGAVYVTRNININGGFTSIPGSSLIGLDGGLTTNFNQFSAALSLSYLYGQLSPIRMQALRIESIYEFTFSHKSPLVGYFGMGTHLSGATLNGTIERTYSWIEAYFISGIRILGRTRPQGWSLESLARISDIETGVANYTFELTVTPTFEIQVGVNQFMASLNIKVSFERLPQSVDQYAHSKMIRNDNVAFGI